MAIDTDTLLPSLTLPLTDTAKIYQGLYFFKMQRQTIAFACVRLRV